MVDYSYIMYSDSTIDQARNCIEELQERLEIAERRIEGMDEELAKLKRDVSGRK
tara:strand:+ start:146 stop:307 length:162 start_codon:yes stop_codon:yes gene_type:complete